MRPRAAEVLIEDGRARLVRRRETFEDLVAPRCDPDRTRPTREPVGMSLLRFRDSVFRH